MCPWIFNVFIDGMIKEVKMGLWKRGVRFMGDGREWIFPGLLYAGDLVLCGESEEDLRAMLGRFA